MTRVELVPRIPGGRRPRGRIVGALPADGAFVTVQWDDGLTSGIRSQFLRELPRVVIRSSIVPSNGQNEPWRGWYARTPHGGGMSTASFTQAVEWAHHEASRPWYGVPLRERLLRH